MTPAIGVLALQGAFRAHGDVLEGLGVDVVASVPMCWDQPPLLASSPGPVRAGETVTITIDGAGCLRRFVGRLVHPDGAPVADREVPQGLELAIGRARAPPNPPTLVLPAPRVPALTDDHPIGHRRDPTRARPRAPW